MSFPKIYNARETNAGKGRYFCFSVNCLVVLAGKVQYFVLLTTFFLCLCIEFFLVLLYVSWWVT